MTNVTYLKNNTRYFCTVKLTLVSILSILILSNILRVTAIYSWYALDMDSFVEQLCENKDKPQLKCNGKCYLSKMMAESSKKESPSPLLTEWEPQFFYDASRIVLPELAPVTMQRNNFYYLFQVSDTDLASVFHPPRNS